MSVSRVGIDNYGLHPLGLSPMDTLEWAVDHGADGVQFSGIDSEYRKMIDTAYLNDLAQYAASNDLYIEWGGGQHIPRDMNSWSKKDFFAHNETAAKEAEILGARIVRSCSEGLMRWNPDNPSTETLLQETAEALKSQRQMLRDHNVTLAIETHFEFTTHELLRLFDMCDAEPGDYLGICLDTMNLLTMLEDPVAGTKRILPWVVCTHIKDGIILVDNEKLSTYPAEIGTGIVRLKEIIELLKTLPWEVNLSIEDHGGEFILSIFDPEFMSGFPDLTREEFDKLIVLAEISKGKIKQDACKITSREEWSEVCEQQLYRDISTLKEIVKL